MEQLVIILALNGALVLTVSMVAGLFLYLSILNDRDPAAWHLLHAGGAGRGVMLLALAALIEQPALTPETASLAAWLIIFFVWTSMLAMGTRAISGDRGLRLEGSLPNRLVYISYGLGTLTVFPGFAILIYGLLKALLAS
jgi:hypothetical protein